MGHIGPVVRKRRERLGWTIQKLATLSGLDGSFVSRLEREESGYSTETEDRIAKTLNMSVSELHGVASNVTAGPIDYRRVPILDYVQAANLNFAATAPWSGVAKYVMTSLDHSATTFALRIKGDSMEPEFRDGDIVVVDPAISPLPGDFVVATNAGGGEALFKKYRLVGNDAELREIFELAPLNSDYPTLRSDEKSLQIVGVMMEHRRPRRRSAS